MEPNKVSLELQKKTILIIFITLISITSIYLFASSIPSRVSNGNQGRIAIKVLDGVRRPFLDIHEVESSLLSDGYSNTIQEDLNHAIEGGRHLLAGFKTVSSYNPELLERVGKLSNIFEEWVRIEQDLFDQFAWNSSTDIGLMINTETLNVIARTAKYFSNTMSNLGDAEIPIHNDIKEGSQAVKEMIIVGVILMVSIVSMMFSLQWIKNEGTQGIAYS